MKVARLRELFLRLVDAHEDEAGTHNATRVRVNIHVIAAQQLLGRIRSVITGLKIKWEFFISEAAIAAEQTGGGGVRGALMKVDSKQMGRRRQRSSGTRHWLHQSRVYF